jgi:hypothetical protein
MTADNRLRRDALLAIYHGMTAMALIYLYRAGEFKSGPCNIGAGIMLSLLFILVLLVLLPVSLIQFFRDRQNRFFFFMNVGVLITWGVIIFLSTL